MEGIRGLLDRASTLGDDRCIMIALFLLAPRPRFHFVARWQIALMRAAAVPFAEERPNSRLVDKL